MATPARQLTRRLRDPAQVDLQPLEADPRYRKLRDELDQVEKRIALAERRRKIALARSRGQESTRSVAERAESLLAGGQVVVLPPATEIEAANEERSILAQARRAKCEEIEQLRSEISFEACQRFAPVIEDALRATLSALAELHQALDVQRVIRSRLIGSGYQLNESGLPTAQFLGAAALSAPGDPDAHSMSPAGRLRDWMAAKGLI
jgi:hypothetical protein